MKRRVKKVLAALGVAVAAFGFGGCENRTVKHRSRSHVTSGTLTSVPTTATLRKPFFESPSGLVEHGLNNAKKGMNQRRSQRVIKQMAEHCQDYQRLHPRGWKIILNEEIDMEIARFYAPKVSNPAEARDILDYLKGEKTNLPCEILDKINSGLPGNMHDSIEQQINFYRIQCERYGNNPLAILNGEISQPGISPLNHAIERAEYLQSAD